MNSGMFVNTIEEGKGPGIVLMSRVTFLLTWLKAYKWHMRCLIVTRGLFANKVASYNAWWFMFIGLALY